LKKDKQDYSFSGEYSGLHFLHSTLVKVANWDLDLHMIHTTKWQTHVKVTHRIKQASASTAYYDKSTLAFRPTIPLLHDVELNPGPKNCSTTNKFKKSSGNVKKAHLNIRLLKCREHCVLVKEAVQENKCDILYSLYQKPGSIIRVQNGNRNSWLHYVQY